MRITVYSAECAGCGKNKVQMATLARATWNVMNAELRRKNIRTDTEARARYNELRAKLTAQNGDLDAIVETDAGRVFWLREVTPKLIEEIL